MGRGIEARAKRCHDYWARHLEFSKLFQERCLESGDSIAVLGAGALLDLNKAATIENFRRIELWDANPELEGSWKSFRDSSPKPDLIEFHFSDLTGSLDDWTQTVETFCSKRASRIEEVITLLFSLRAHSGRSEWQNCDCILSLNLLSQLPIYWRDRLEKILYDRFDLDTDDQGLYEVPLEEAIISTMKELQISHLKLLSQSQADNILLISDSEFIYYSNGRSDWQTYPALHFFEPMEIFGFEQVRKESWFWHIAPQCIEQDDYGAIHDVIALNFRKIR